MMPTDPFQCRVLEALQKRGYETMFVEEATAAATRILSEANDYKSVGWGGSETIKALGVREKLTAVGKEVRDHATDVELFLLSANAVTADGRLVNIDGSGNRIAASIFGPKRVVYVIGRNKLVDGGLDDAIARIKREACPPNARRLGRKTPCALTGVCTDCDSPERMCKVTAVFDRPPTHTSTLVILVNEDLGY